MSKAQDEQVEACRLCGSPAIGRRFMDGHKFASMEVFYECGSALGTMAGETEFAPRCEGRPHLVCGELARKLLEALPENHPLRLNIELRKLAATNPVTRGRT